MGISEIAPIVVVATLIAGLIPRLRRRVTSSMTRRSGTWVGSQRIKRHE